MWVLQTKEKKIKLFVALDLLPAIVKPVKANNKSSILHDIATKVLGLETLETRKSDSLDFHDLAVWQIREALEAAYAAGRASK